MIYFALIVCLQGLPCTFTLYPTPTDCIEAQIAWLRVPNVRTECRVWP